MLCPLCFYNSLILSFNISDKTDSSTAGNVDTVNDVVNKDESTDISGLLVPGVGSKEDLKHVSENTRDTNANQTDSLSFQNKMSSLKVDVDNTELQDIFSDDGKLYLQMQSI